MSRPPSRAALAPTSSRAPSYLTPLMEATRKVQLEGTSCETKGVPEGCWGQGAGSGDGGKAGQKRCIDVNGGGSPATSPASWAPAGSGSPHSPGLYPEPPAWPAAAPYSSPGPAPAEDRVEGLVRRGRHLSQVPHPADLTKHWSPWGQAVLSGWQDCSKKWSQKWAPWGASPGSSSVGLKC